MAVINPPNDLNLNTPTPISKNKHLGPNLGLARTAQFVNAIMFISETHSVEAFGQNKRGRGERKIKKRNVDGAERLQQPNIGVPPAGNVIAFPL